MQLNVDTKTRMCGQPKLEAKKEQSLNMSMIYRQYMIATRRLKLGEHKIPMSITVIPSALATR